MGRVLQIICCVVVAVALGGSAPQTKSSGQSQTAGNAAGNNDHTPEIGAAGMARIARALEAANSGPDAAYEKKRAADDLKAQQDMALWAFWAMIFALAQVGVAIATLVLLKQTLDATRTTLRHTATGTMAAHQAARAARESNRLLRHVHATESRAWVTIKIELAGRPMIFAENGVSGLELKVTATNIGKTPATGLRLFFDSFSDLDGGEYQSPAEKLEAMVRAYLSNEIVLPEITLLPQDWHRIAPCLGARYDMDKSVSMHTLYGLFVTTYFVEGIEGRRVNCCIYRFSPNVGLKGPLEAKDVFLDREPGGYAT